MKQQTNSKFDVVLSVHDLNAWYGEAQALRNISFDVERNKVTALIGPLRLWQEHTNPLF